MQFTSGDYIALGMVALSVAAFAVREWRATVTAKTKQATDDSILRGIVNGLTSKLDEVIRELRDLEDKRQKHEVDCAKIQERTAAAQSRTAEILTEHGRSIGQLQGQIRHVVTGSANKIVEIKTGP